MIYWAIKVKKLNKFLEKDPVMGNFISESPTLYKTEEEVNSIISNMKEWNISIPDMEDIDTYDSSDLETCKFTI